MNICEIKNGKGNFNYNDSDNNYKFRGKLIHGNLTGKVEVFFVNSKSSLLMEVELSAIWKSKEFDLEGRLKYENEFLNVYKRRGKEYNEEILEYEG